VHVFRPGNDAGRSLELPVRREWHPQRFQIQGLVHFLNGVVVSDVHVVTPNGADRRRTLFDAGRCWKLQRRT